MPPKFRDDQSLLRHRKLGMMNVTERHTGKQTDIQTFSTLIDSWSCRSETYPKINLGRSKKITDGSGVP